MNNLDNFYNKKLQNREFEFKDSYWEDAEQLIIADEKKRKGSWYFWLLGLFLLLVTGGIILSSNNTDQAPLNENNKTKQKSAIVIENSDSDPKNANLSLANVPSSIKKTVVQNETESQELNPKIDASDDLFKKQSASSKTNYPTTSPSKIIEIPENELKNAGSKTKSIQVKENNSTVQPDGVMNENSIEKTIQKERIKHVASLSPITTNLELLENPAYAELKKVKLPKEKKFAFGITASGLIYPAVKNEKNWIGFSAGALAKHHFTRKLALNAEILYTYRSGTFNISSSSTQTKFGFGKRVITYLHKPENLHFLELPIYVQYKVGKHRFEAGGMAGYLFGVRGRIEKQSSLYPWERSDENDFESENYASGWIAKDGFNSLNVSGLIGYKYRLSDGFLIGLRGVYRFGDLTQKSFDPIVKKMRHCILIFRRPGCFQNNVFKICL